MWKKWLEENNIEWVLPIYQQVSSEIWVYRCLGILIHPNALVTAEQCAQPYESYATGVFSWKSDFTVAYLNKNELYKITSIEGHLSHRLTTFGYTNEQNIKWIGKDTVPGIVIMSFEHPIDSLRPMNISQSLSLKDIYDANVEKECVHLIFMEDDETSSYTPKKIRESIMTRSELFGRYNKTYDYLYQSNNNVSIEFDSDANFFGTLDKLNLKSYDTQRGLLGSPILCRRNDSYFSQYSLAGLLTSQLHNGWYEYSGVKQEEKWIKEKLSYLK
ncbi:uncharacterized protein LOC130673071 [Microplitis mediator]|uniref:uncharacterized protein LOC130673071 n=1 Tax=Microplitis mediator TaxID=375433 RepID=UPI0025532A2D|nr:uncharacterized protein LOC130673071 [Microplitis mediator]